jgi:PKD repeat protein
VLLAGNGQTLSVTFTAADANFDTVSANARIDVSKAILSVVADNQSMVYGGALPKLTATYQGLVHGDAVAVVSGTPVLSTNASANSPVGSYPITVDATKLSAANYSIDAVNGMMTIVINSDISPVTVEGPGSMMVGTPANFSINGLPAGNDGVAWDFGDGDVSNVASPSHAYAAPGHYVVTVTYTDPQTGLSQSQPLTIEAQCKPFRIRQAEFVLASGFDTARITGIVHVPRSMTVLGQTVVFNVGGNTRTFVLDSKGRCKISGGTLTLKMKNRQGTTIGEQEVPFTLTLCGDLAMAFKTMPLDVSGYPTAINVEIQMCGTFYEEIQKVRFSSGKKGVFARTKYF